MTETKKPGGRSLGTIHAETAEHRELVEFLRTLLRDSSCTMRDLEGPTNFGRTSLSDYFSGKRLPTRTFVEKVVWHLARPREREQHLRKALTLLDRAWTPRSALPAQAEPPPAEVVGEPSARALAVVAATAQDQAALALQELTRAQARNVELITERDQAQQMVLALSGLTADLQRQIDESASRQDPGVDAHLEELRAQLDSAQSELTRARAARDEAGLLAQRLQLRTDELEEQVSLLRRGTATVPGQPAGAGGLPRYVQEAMFQQDVARMLNSAQQFLDDGQAGRDRTRDEWGMRPGLHNSSTPVERWRTAARVLARALGCTAVVAGAAGRQLAGRSSAPGWVPLLTLVALGGLFLCSDLTGPALRVGTMLRAWLLAQPPAVPVRFSARDLARRAGRGLLGLALAALSIGIVTTTGRGSQLWWVMIPMVAGCAWFIVGGRDPGLRSLVQETLGRWAVDLQASRGPGGTRVMSAVWTDSEWLEARMAELGQAFAEGWKRAPLWAKVVRGVLVVCLVLLLFAYLSTLVPHLDASATPHSGVPVRAFASAIDSPVRAYLAAHTEGLPVSAAAVRFVWLAAGAALVLIGYTTRSFGARLTWTLWGAASAAMVWWGTAGPARQVATALAVLWWGIASVLALDGLGVRSVPAQSNHVTVNGAVGGDANSGG